jgi:hypothetical protein
MAAKLIGLSPRTDNSLGVAMGLLGIASSIFSWPHWVGYPCLVLAALFFVLAFVRSRHSETPKVDDGPKRAVYRDTLRIGTTCLRNLEQATEQTGLPHWSNEHLNQLARMVDAAVRRCWNWDADAQAKITQIAGDDAVTLYAMNPFTRPKPTYMRTNGMESSIWDAIAGRLDWLASELRDS